MGNWVHKLRGVWAMGCMGRGVYGSWGSPLGALFLWEWVDLLAPEFHFFSLPILFLSFAPLPVAGLGAHGKWSKTLLPSKPLFLF